MRIGSLDLLVTGHLWSATPCLAQERVAEAPVSNVLRFFNGLSGSDVETTLRAVRIPPLSSRGRDLIRTTLPAAGELTPTRAEARNLEAL